MRELCARGLWGSAVCERVVCVSSVEMVEWKRDCVKKLCVRELYVKELCVKLVAWVAKDSCAKTIESGLGNSLSWLHCCRDCCRHEKRRSVTGVCGRQRVVFPHGRQSNHFPRSDGSTCTMKTERHPQRHVTTKHGGDKQK